MVNVIVAFPKIEDAKNIKNLLVRNGFTVSAVCTTGTQALAHADEFGIGVIVSSYKLSDMVYSEIKEDMPRGFEMLLLASKNHLEESGDIDVHSLAMPLKTTEFLQAVANLVRGMEKKRQKQRLKPQSRSDADRECIQQAKALLMEKNKMTEVQAHKYIQKCSMDSCTNMVETAQMVLSMMK